MPSVAPETELRISTTSMTPKAEAWFNEHGKVHHTQVEDLHELLYGTWDEERVLENLRLRFLSGKPYTGMGNVIIALNPCRSLVDLYDRDTQVRRHTSALLLQLKLELLIPGNLKMKSQLSACRSLGRLKCGPCVSSVQSM